MVSPVICVTASSTSGGANHERPFTSRKVRRATQVVRLFPSTQGMTPHQPFGKDGRLIDEIGFAVVRVPARSIEGANEAVTMDHMMSRRRLSDLQGGCMAAHQVRRCEVVDRLRRLDARHGRRQRVP